MKHKIILPAQQKGMNDLKNDLEAYDLNIKTAEKILIQAAEKSSRITGKACDHIGEIVKNNRGNWLEEYNSDKLLCKWFGKAEDPIHIRGVHNRMESACNRIDEGLTLHLRPQNKLPKTASGNETHFGPKAMKVFPSVFRNGTGSKEVASVIIHNLLLLWFRDLKAKDTELNKVEFARKLAQESPKKARLNAANYERFFKELSDA